MSTKRKKTKEYTGSTQLSVILQKRLTEMGSNMRQMSTATGYAYDYCRRICKGLSYPGEKALTKISSYTGLDYDELKQVVELDKSFESASSSGLLEMLSTSEEKEDTVLIRLKGKWNLISEKDKWEILDIVDLRAKGIDNRL